MWNNRGRPSWHVGLAWLLATCALVHAAAAQNPLGEPPFESTRPASGFDPFNEPPSAELGRFPAGAFLATAPVGTSPRPDGFYLPPEGFSSPPGGGRAVESISGWENVGGLEPFEVEAAPPWSDPQFPEQAPVDVVAVDPGGAKPGIWQGASFDSFWLAGGDAEGLGINHLRLSTHFAFPFFTRSSPLVLTPLLAVRYLSGPDARDLPARVYDTSLEFRWLRPISEWLAVDLAVAPGYYSDFERDNSDALRITGHGLIQITGPHAARWVMGVAYFDRQDVKLLPVGGVIWSPSDVTRFELILPRPRIARRFACGAHAQWWGYVGGQFGGGSWAVQRQSGASDEVSYRDYRVKLGIERKAVAGLSGHLEVGYVFGRRLEYRGGTPDFEPDDTVMLGSGWSY